MTIEAMKQALDYLDAPSSKVWPAGTQYNIIKSLRAAIEQAEKQEPVAWVECDGELVWNNREAAIGRNLYTAPPQREWQGLTDEEIKTLWDNHIIPVFNKNGISPFVFARAIEAKLREKNSA